MTAREAIIDALLNAAVTEGELELETCWEVHVRPDVFNQLRGELQIKDNYLKLPSPVGEAYVTPDDDIINEELWVMPATVQ